MTGLRFARIASPGPDGVEPRIVVARPDADRWVDLRTAERLHLERTGACADAARRMAGALVPGSRVNLERAMSAQARFGGHVVQGHVDATVRITAIEPGERWSVVRFDLPVDLAPYVVEKGSVTLDGVSLTVASRQEASFSVSLIPTTLELTTFGAARVGGLVNVEVDVLAKYVEQMLAPRLAALDIRLVELDARLAASEGRA